MRRRLPRCQIQGAIGAGGNIDDIIVEIGDLPDAVVRRDEKMLELPAIAVGDGSDNKTGIAAIIQRNFGNLRPST
jgi:hypothetical protein